MVQQKKKKQERGGKGQGVVGVSWGIKSDIGKRRRAKKRTMGKNCREIRGKKTKSRTSAGHTGETAA